MHVHTRSRCRNFRRPVRCGICGGSGGSWWTCNAGGGLLDGSSTVPNLENIWSNKFFLYYYSLSSLSSSTKTKTVYVGPPLIRLVAFFLASFFALPVYLIAHAILSEATCDRLFGSFTLDTTSTQTMHWEIGPDNKPHQVPGKRHDTQSNRCQRARRRAKFNK